MQFLRGRKIMFLLAKEAATTVGDRVGGDCPSAIALGGQPAYAKLRTEGLKHLYTYIWFTPNELILGSLDLDKMLASRCVVFVPPTHT